jgi:hypothetical protein
MAHGAFLSEVRRFIDGGGRYSEAISAIASVLNDQIREARRSESSVDAQEGALIEKDVDEYQGLHNALTSAANVAYLIEYDQMLPEAEAELEAEAEMETEYEPAMAANRRR